MCESMVCGAQFEFYSRKPNYMLCLLVDDVVKDGDDNNGNDYRQPGFNIGEHLPTPLLRLLKKYVIMYPLYRVLAVFSLVLKLEGANEKIEE